MLDERGLLCDIELSRTSAPVGIFSEVRDGSVACGLFAIHVACDWRRNGGVSRDSCQVLLRGGLLAVLVRSERSERASATFVTLLEAIWRSRRLVPGLANGVVKAARALSFPIAVSSYILEGSFFRVALPVDRDW